MKKYLIPILLAVPLALGACGSPVETEEPTAEATVETNDKLEQLDTIRQYNKQVYKDRGKEACFDTLYKQVAKTKNLEDTIENEKSATFVMNTTEGKLTEGSMKWYSTFETFAGIPWEHEVHCTADISTDPATVLYLDAHVPGL